MVKNTFFCKPEAELVTYRSVGIKDWRPPWHPRQYSQMDYILGNESWKNGITDIFATEVHDIDTDHKMLVANVRLKTQEKNAVSKLLLGLNFINLREMKSPIITLVWPKKPMMSNHVSFDMLKTVFF